MEYYTYILIDPISGKIFYVGKGQKLRMYAHVKDVQRNIIPNKNNTYLGRKIQKILDSGLKVQYKKIFITENEQAAYDKEIELISEIGLKNLCNLTTGGEGLTKSHSKETRKKMSDNNARYWLGKSIPEETKLKMAESQRGKIHSNETKKKISSSLKGNLNNLGNPHSDKAKLKISKSQKRRHAKSRKRM